MIFYIRLKLLPFKMWLKFKWIQFKAWYNRPDTDYIFYTIERIASYQRSNGKRDYWGGRINNDALIAKLKKEIGL